MTDDNNKIQQYKKAGLEVLGTTEQMSVKLELSEKRLTMVHEFIKENFREGIDYGPADPRNPKPTLLKAGAERVCKLFNTHPVWRMDIDTWKMLGEPKGTVCYICEIVDNTTGEIVGEGRGSDTVGNKARDSNKATKIAEKCSLVDATLYAFGLSEMFTQDMAPNINKLDEAKAALVADVDVIRQGCESSLTTIRFLHIVSKNFLHDDGPRSIGAVAALRKAVIEDQLYDLATGERIPG